MLRHVFSLTFPLYGFLLYGFQQSPLTGTWELTRIFRAGPAPGTHVVAIDSTVYVRVTLESHPGDWISGMLYRRYFGEPERRTVAWTIGVGDTLRLGTPLVPGADSIELKRVRPDAPYPATVVEVVTAP